MKIIVFTTSSCPKCIELKKLLQEKGLEFEEHNTEEPEGLAELAMLGTYVQSMPVLVWDDKVITDMEEAKQKIKEVSREHKQD